jgi:hypothetical protein
MAITKIYKGTNDVTSSFLKAYKGGTEIFSPILSSPIYGVAGLYQSNPLLTRTDDAVDMSFTINSSNGTIVSDFNDVFPWNEATIETINGNKFLHMPEMWFRVGWDSSLRITDIAVSKTQGVSGNWYKVDPFYYSCYGGSVAGNKLKSVSGVARQHTKTRAEFRTYATANGSGYFQLDLYHKTVMNFLWLIEWATKDSDSIMTGNKGYGTASNTGGTDALSTPSGFNITTKQMRWHYIEDFVGNYLEFVDGATGGFGDSTYYVTADTTKFSDLTSGLSSLSYSYPTNASSSNRCITALGWDVNNPFLVQPIEQLGTDYTAYFCDANSSSNNVVLLAGAYWVDSFAVNGVTCFNRSSVSVANSNIGGRLLYKP